MENNVYAEMTELEHLAIHMISDDTFAAYGDVKMIREYLQRHDELYSDFIPPYDLPFDHRVEILSWLVVYMQDHNIGTKDTSPITKLPSWTPQFYEIIDGKICVTGKKDRESDYNFN